MNPTRVHRTGKEIDMFRHSSLFVMAVLVTAGAAHAGSCRWEGGNGNGNQCDAIDCDYEGGKAKCTDPQLVPPNNADPSKADKEGYQYSMCGGPNYVIVERLWCEAAGGTWNSGNCDNLPPVVIGGGGTLVTDDGAATSISDTWVQKYNAPCPVQNVSDSGYGAGYWDANCATADQTFVKTHSVTRLNLTAGRVRTYDILNGSTCQNAATGIVVINRYRSTKCREGYTSRINSKGETECVQPVACGGKAGNPICAANGVKTQSELDYRSGGIGGLEFTRYFNSGGYYRPNAASAGLPNTYADFWRHTYDRRIFAADSSDYTIASALRPDGSVVSFDLNGRALQNFDGAADVLVALTSGGASVGWRLTLADSSVELYDAAGKLQSITTREGLTTTVAYNSAGLASLVTDQFGHTLTLTYDVYNRLQSMTSPGGNVYAYGYDFAGRLASVTYPGNRTRNYVYEDSNNPDLITGIVDENNQRYATYGYDSSGRGILTQHAGGAESYSFAYYGYATVVTDALGTSRTFSFADANGVYKPGNIAQPSSTNGTVSELTTYDANGNVATTTDYNGNRTNYQYDLSRNLEISRTEGLDASGGTSSITRTIATQWHPLYRLPTQITQPSGVPGVNRVTTMTYDANGNMSTRTISAGSQSRTWTFTYDTYGRMLTRDGPRSDVNDVTTFTYYADNDSCSGCRGQLHTLTNALGQVTEFAAYDGDSRVTRVVDRNGNATVLAYDPRGWVTSRSDAAGTSAAETTTITYDNVGQILRVTRPDGGFLAYQYDAAHRLTEVGDNAGDVIQYTLDAMGNRVQRRVFDPQDNLRRSQSRVFDALDRLVGDIGAYQDSMQYGYDENGNRVSVLDPNGALTSDSFDALNRRTASTDPLAGTTRYGYDADDNLISVQDATGLTTSYSYNALGDPAAQTSPDTGTTSYTSDSAGNRASQSDARGVTTTYVYDALDRVTSATAGSGSNAVSVDFGYDESANGVGRLTSISAPGSTISYVYDELGRTVEQDEAVGRNVLSIYYTYSNGQLIEMDTPGGNAITYSYDTSGRISEVDVNGQVVVSAVAYLPFGDVDQFTFGDGTVVHRAHDLDSRIRQLTLGPVALADAGARTYSYDVLNRLTTANLGNATQAFAYDAIGDRTQETVNGTTTTYGYQTLTHWLTTLSGGNSSSFAYDPAGNQTTRDAHTLTYDARGRLISASDGSTTVTYTINGRGERIEKTSPDTYQRFVYTESGALFGEYAQHEYCAVGRSCTTEFIVQREYIRLGDLLIGVMAAPPPAGTGLTIDPSLFYIYTDQLGAPRAVVSADDGHLAWSWDFGGAPFGENAPNEDPSNSGTPFTLNLRFPGQYFDRETGLNYNYFRDYDPNTGRFVESDPTGLDSGINTYGYALQNPLQYTDVLGLWVKFCMRQLHDKNSPPTSRGNPVRHDYLDVSGVFYGFTGGDDPTLWGMFNRGKEDHDEMDGGRCAPYCMDDRFDRYVLDAIAKIGYPKKYFALGWYGNGDTLGMNCQHWVDLILKEATRNYLKNEPCPFCSKR